MTKTGPKSLREALCHDVMDVSVWDVVYIKKSLKNTPATAGHWGLDKMAKLDYDSDCEDGFSLQSSVRS